MLNTQVLLMSRISQSHSDFIFLFSGESSPARKRDQELLSRATTCSAVLKLICTAKGCPMGLLGQGLN